MFWSHSSKAENQILSHFGLNLSVCHASVWFCNDNFFSSHFAFSHFCNVGFILINVQWSFPAFLYEWIEMCLICVFCHSCSQHFESFCLKTTNCRCCLKDCVCRNLGAVLFRWFLWKSMTTIILSFKLVQSRWKLLPYHFVICFIKHRWNSRCRNFHSNPCCCHYTAAPRLDRPSTLCTSVALRRALARKGA